MYNLGTNIYTEQNYKHNSFDFALIFYELISEI